MYKSYDTFFFVTRERKKKIDKMGANAFSHSKEVCKRASGSKCDHTTKQN